MGSQVEDVTGATLLDFVGQFATDDGVEGLDDLEDSGAAAGAKVPGLDAGLLLAEVVEGDEMTSGEVKDVDIVSNGCAVARVVVCKCQYII